MESGSKSREVDPGRSGGGSPWDSRNLAPVALALAAAIVICAVPLSYRILQCPSFESGFSLEQLFSFSCRPRADTVEPTGGGLSKLALAAPTLAPPKGYVAYRVDNGVARTSGSITPYGDAIAPSFHDVEEGLLLVSTNEKRLRQRPFSQSTSRVYPSGQCFKVIDGARIEDEPREGGRSGGWLPVEVTTCPVEHAPASLPASDGKDGAAGQPRPASSPQPADIEQGQKLSTSAPTASSTRPKAPVASTPPVVRKAQAPSWSVELIDRADPLRVSVAPDDPTRLTIEAKGIPADYDRGCKTVYRDGNVADNWYSYFPISNIGGRVRMTVTFPQKYLSDQSYEPHICYLNSTTNSVLWSRNVASGHPLRK